MDVNNNENQKTNAKCITCDQITKNRCSKCKSVHYCKRECQVSDWQTHKLFCASLPIPPKKLAGRYKTITGILLSPDSLTPQMVEVPMDIKFEGFTLPNCEKLMGAPESQNYMQVNPVTNRHLPDTLVFIFRDNFLNDGSKANKCIENMYKGKNDYPWKGPVIVIKMKGQHVEENLYTDVNCKDFKDVVDYLCWYGANNPQSRFNYTLNKQRWEDMGFQTLSLDQL